MASKREPRVDAKLKRAHKDLQRELWELRNPPDPDQKPLSFDALQVEVPRIFGFTASAGALSDWLAWYGLNERMELAEARMLQAKIQLAKDPSLSPKALSEAGRVIFMAEALANKDRKGFASVETLEQGREKLKQGQQKLKQNEKRLSQTDRSLEHDARRIVILERKAARFDEMEAKAKELKKGGGLTAEMLELLEKQLKLL